MVLTVYEDLSESMQGEEPVADPAEFVSASVSPIPPLSGSAAPGHTRGSQPFPVDRPSGHRRLVASFTRSLASLDRDGRLANADDPEHLGYMAASNLVAVSHWSAHLGPFYSEQGVAKLLAQHALGATKHAPRELLALRTGSGQVVYPAFQFEGQGLVQGLVEVLEILRAAPISMWTSASWLVSRDPEMDGLSPIEALRRGRPEEVRVAASQWSSAVSG